MLALALLTRSVRQPHLPSPAHSTCPAPHSARRLLATLCALCSLVIVAAEATISGALLPNCSLVAAALRATAGAPPLLHCRLLRNR